MSNTLLILIGLVLIFGGFGNLVSSICINAIRAFLPDSFYQKHKTNRFNTKYIRNAGIKIAIGIVLVFVLIAV